MLILQRKKGQSLIINETITLTVIETGSDWVRLAIDAPREIPILRSELKEAAQENAAAAQTVPKALLEQFLGTNEF